MQSNSYEFLEPSEEAKNPDHHKFKKIYNFPYDLVPEGKSFSVTLDQIKDIQTLRVTTSRYGKQLGKKFRVHNHETVFEVYHVPRHEWDMSARAPVGTTANWGDVEKGKDNE